MFSSPQNPGKLAKGFTLAELLISLLILGEIATFTIPKILTSQRNASTVAAAKEMAAMVSAAYAQAQLDGIVTSTTTMSNLTSYMNYVSVDTASTLDDHLNANYSMVCGTNITCLKMHSGGTLFWFNSVSFGGTATTNSIHFLYDPDSSRIGIAGDDPGKSICFVLYYNGRITTRADVAVGTVDSSQARSPGAYDPSWFSW